MSGFTKTGDLHFAFEPAYCLPNSPPSLVGYYAGSYAGTLPQWHHEPPNNSPIDDGKGWANMPADSLTQRIANQRAYRPSLYHHQWASCLVARGVIEAGYQRNGIPGESHTGAFICRHWASPHRHTSRDKRCARWNRFCPPTSTDAHRMNAPYSCASWTVGLADRSAHRRTTMEIIRQIKLFSINNKNHQAISLFRKYG